MGIIIGAGIYQTAPDVASSAGSEWGVLGLWILGGALSLCGALCYAELATAYPRQGGDYVYLTRAYGKWAGFLFGWLQLLIVRPGDIAVMAFAFATYGVSILPETIRGGESYGSTILACGAVAILTIINALGVKQGKWTQNLLTIAKVGGILVIVGAALAFPSEDGIGDLAPSSQQPTSFSLALILVLFTYGGWNEMAYVGAGDACQVPFISRGSGDRSHSRFGVVHERGNLYSSCRLFFLPRYLPSCDCPANTGSED